MSDRRDTRPSLSAALRWTRAALVGAVAVAVGTLAHVGADGRLPGAVGLVSVLVLTTAAAVPFLARQASAVRVALLLVAGQTLVHGQLSLLAGHGGHGPGPGSDADPSVAAVPGPPTPMPAADSRVGSFRELAHGTAEPAAAVAPDAAVAAPLGHLLDHLAGQPPQMVLGHLAAAAAVGLWLAIGERALFVVLALLAAPVLRPGALGAAAAGLLAAVAGAAACLRAARTLRGGSRTVVPLRHLVTGAVARRGPPALLAV